jgi:redox-sensitive bicupin YhaK (pirin superfamily)
MKLIIVFRNLGKRLKVLHDAYTAYVFAMDLKTKATFALYSNNRLILYTWDGECSLRGTHESLHKTLISSPKG